MLEGVITKVFLCKIGMNPKWKETTKIFLTMPELDMLSFTVKNNVTSDIIGCHILPVSCVAAGTLLLYYFKITDDN